MIMIMLFTWFQEVFLQTSSFIAIPMPSEIECMVAEMLEVSIIQPSQISFVAIVVLVHKKDGSWHMCLDYRELNKITIKDKFPIPIIHEL